MGLQEKSGIQEDDIKMAMKGHVKDGYKVKSHPEIINADK